MAISKNTRIMGVLNITPDSFSDGGLYMDVNKAVSRAYQMVEEGVDIIDIGGESSRPGAEFVSVAEEIKRVIPVIKKLVKKINVPISIDTYKPEVARQALEEGVQIINDITGFHNKEYVKTVSRYKPEVIIMHMKGTPRTMQDNPKYKNLIEEIINYISEGVKTAEEFGISRDKIIIDPGIGFGKTVEHNLEIIANLSEFKKLGLPVLIGPSRKSFIGKLLDVDVNDRLEGTLAIVAICVYNNVDVIRVHDIKETYRVVKVVNEVSKFNPALFV